jgi:hypothetical protein
MGVMIFLNEKEAGMRKTEVALNKWQQGITDSRSPPHAVIVGRDSGSRRYIRLNDA